jgi:hypothetical protein
MEENSRFGFEYYLTKETIKNYQEKPVELRLRWLYFGNLLRKQYPENVIKLQNKFREGVR